jgi:2,3-dihydroxybiphenyl 1,2-dioxygenase
MTKGTVRALGYLGITTPNLDAWAQFATRLVGMQAIGGAENDLGALYLKVDGRMWRLAVHEAEDEGLAYVGWEVAGKYDLQILVDAVEATGATVKYADASEAQSRGVVELVRFQDPAGTPIEVFYGQHCDYQFASPLGIEFVTDPCGFGHVMLSVTAYDECVDFYCNALGFRVSDFADLGGVRATFLRCNPRHHSLALRDASLADPTSPFEQARIRHLMIEVSRQDDVGRALDRCGDLGYKLSRTLGRHSNDEMFSFYVKSPSDFDVEVGHGGLLIDETNWTPKCQIGADLWGHRRAPGDSTPHRSPE